MKQYEELEELCVFFDKGYADIEDLVGKWGSNKKKIEEVKAEIYKTYVPDTIIKGYPLGSAFLYLLSEFFQDPKAIALLKAKHSSELTPEGLSVLTFWEKNPAFWCYFSVKKRLDENFSLIEDLLTGEEHTLYSPSVDNLYARESSKGLRSLCLMLPNGKCLQTVGIIRSFRIPVSDFKFYCSLFKPQKGLKAILKEHYATFFKLDTIANIPLLICEGQEMGFAWQGFTLPEFDINKLGGTWDRTTLKAQQRFSLYDPDSSMDKLPNKKLFYTNPRVMALSILRDTTTGEMAIVTNTEVAYTFLSALVKRSYPELKLPKKPSVFICASLHTLLLSMDIPLPWKGYDKLPSENPTLQHSKGLLDLYLASRETKKSFDSNAISKGRGMDSEEAQRVLDEYKTTDRRSFFEDLFDDFFDEEEFYEVPPEDKKFELKNVPMPLDEEEDGELLYQSLTDSDLFSVGDSEKAEKLIIEEAPKAFAEEIITSGILAFIEEMFIEEFEELHEIDYPLMNTFFWILLHKGKKWVPLRSYAIEMMKWIPGLIFEDFEDDEEFINVFSLFVFNKLSPLGICSLTNKPTLEEIEKGTYMIKGTEAFYSLLKLSDDVVLDT
ncbi:MAG: hypothetical protein RBR15_15535 [Sphaerochaeta sp.]|nr:hypothetical protein [Sphaerochaeta sp.]